MAKKKSFIEPYIGFDLANGKRPFDILIGVNGNPIIGIKLTNFVLQYSADPDSYIRYHSILNQIVMTVGEERIVQKLDVFTKRKYIPEASDNFLKNQYSQHFANRLFKKNDTYLFITDDVNQDGNAKHKYKPTEKTYESLIDKVQKVYMILDQEKLNPSYLKKTKYQTLYSSILTMNFGDVPSYDNIKTDDTHLKIGNKFIKTISLIDKEKVEIPSEVEPYSLLGNGVVAETAVDNFTFLNDLDEYDSLIYNQVITIPNQALKVRYLDKKMKKHEGAASNSPANLIMANEIAEFLVEMETNGQFLVNFHGSIIMSTNSQEKMDELNSKIENQLFLKNIIVSRNTYNQFELFRAALPGNATELKSYDLFLTTSQAALCFFFKEKYPESEDSPIYLQFADRQGVPLKIDLCDLPMKDGRINNRNKFVLGPSGSGKSFLMNNIIEQYLQYNYDIVIIDTGDSYSGTCEYKNGKYIQYTEEKPITMNPFNVPQSELNIEKTDFLTNLIFLIWKGANEEMTSTQRTILDRLINSYYHHYYFGKNKENWFENAPIEKLLHYLRQYNVYEEQLYDEISAESIKPDSHYETLRIPFDATKSAIKKAYRNIMKDLHPDANIKGDFEDQMINFHNVVEAYNTLIDDTKRQVYDETHLIVIKKKDVIKKPVSTTEWQVRIREKAIEKIKKIEEDFQISELSFNSLYEYSEKFLPVYLKNKKHPINDSEFNLRTFHLVLADFYKGGRYEKTLNENSDTTLFEEEMIVFEIDNIKDNPVLFPIVTLIIMDIFIQKMRLRKDRRKALIIEEAWKAIASKLMGGYIVYLYKTVRKFWGEAIVVTQELNDIIGNAVVKDSIINNSDTFILLDQTKFKDNFEQISEILSLNKVEQNKIFTINNLQNKHGRSRFKEFYLKRGSEGEVYGNEVSIEQYLTYTTEKPEKVALSYYYEAYDSHEEAIKAFVKDSKNFENSFSELFTLINLYKAPLSSELLAFYNKIKHANKYVTPIKQIENLMKSTGHNLTEIIKKNRYETAYN